MAVVGFNALEDFIKQRMGEVLRRISVGPIPFPDLPESLQRAATLGAAEALRYQATMRERRGDVTGARDLIQRTGRAMASIDNQRYSLSDLSFGYADANLGPDLVTQMLSALRITGGWPAIIGVALNAGLNLPGLPNDYRNALRRRHAAAHDPSTDVPLTDLVAFTRQARALALAFDGLVSRAGYRLRQGDYALASGAVNVEAAQINVLPFDDLAPNRPQRWRTAIAHARTTGDLIAVTRAGVPVAWRPGDLERGRL
jgi:hypothetical protein